MSSFPVFKIKRVVAVRSWAMLDLWLPIAAKDEPFTEVKWHGILCPINDISDERS